MTDFDFDELDKAVNGALSSDASVPENTNVVPSTPAPQPVSTPPQVPITTAPAPAARRPSGRFMDVVHPSSDMRTQSGGFVAPSRPIPGARPIVTPEAPTAPEPIAQPTVEPLESPFLPDAKVEKRPLGAFSAQAEAPVSVPAEQELLEAPDDPRLEAHTLPDPLDFAQPAQDSETAAQEEPTFETAPAYVEQQPEAPSSPIVESALTEPPTTDEPSGPTSITQQYTEQPSSAPVSGAIYDTEAYHAPVAAAAKKHSGLWVFVWIFLLVVLGAAAGVAFYMFVLPLF